MSAFRKIIVWTNQSFIKALKSLGLSVHKRCHFRRGQLTANEQRGSISTVVTWIEADIQPDINNINTCEIADNKWNEKQENIFKY